MKFERLFESSPILAVLLDDDILKTTGIDDARPQIDTSKDCYLGCFIDGKLAGVAIFEPDNHVCVNYHPNLLKKYRGKNSIPFTIGALKWLVENAPRFLKVNAKFPVSYKGLEQYAIKCGFTKEGLDRDSCQLGDRHCYGITKKEIEAL